MSKYLAIYGKPRYLGIIDYDGEIKNGSNIVVESHRGEELAISAGILTAEQEAQYRQMRSTAEHVLLKRELVNREGLISILER